MTSNALAVNSDGWDSVPQVSNGLIRGRILKFNGEEYLLDKQPIANGASFVVVGVTVAWVKWANRLPEEHRITQDGARHPDRGELPDLDQEHWEAGFDDRPADPWKDTRYIYLINRKTGEQVTFVTDTWGGRIAVGELRDRIALFRTAHPNAAPVVELAAGKMPTRYGLKPRPLFKDVDWIAVADRGEQVPLITSREPDSPTPAVTRRPATRPGDDLDDDIPC